MMTTLRWWWITRGTWKVTLIPTKSMRKDGHLKRQSSQTTHKIISPYPVMSPSLSSDQVSPHQQTPLFKLPATTSLLTLLPAEILPPLRCTVASLSRVKSSRAINAMWNALTNSSQMMDPEQTLVSWSKAPKRFLSSKLSLSTNSEASWSKEETVVWLVWPHFSIRAMSTKVAKLIAMSSNKQSKTLELKLEQLMSKACLRASTRITMEKSVLKSSSPWLKVQWTILEAILSWGFLNTSMWQMTVSWPSHKSKTTLTRLNTQTWNQANA